MNKNDKRKHIENNVAIGIIAAGIIGASIRGGVKVYNYFTNSKRVQKWNSEYGNELRARFVKEFHSNEHVRYNPSLCNKYIFNMEKALTNLDKDECEKIIEDLINDAGESEKTKDEVTDESVKEESSNDSEKAVTPLDPSVVPKCLRDDYTEALNSHDGIFTEEEPDGLVPEKPEHFTNIVRDENCDEDVYEDA